MTRGDEKIIQEVMEKVDREMEEFRRIDRERKKHGWQ